MNQKSVRVRIYMLYMFNKFSKIYLPVGVKLLGVNLARPTLQVKSFRLQKNAVSIIVVQFSLKNHLLFILLIMKGILDIFRSYRPF